MAGVAGVVGKKKAGLIEQMLGVIEHRGPDHVHVHRADGLCAGVRASQLSGTRGNGFATDGQVTALFDGEIYNDRAEGESDAQVVLDLYRKYGRTFASHLAGVFACAVCDGDTVTLARDSVGVRPMYFGSTEDGHFCFASEAKSLVGVTENAQELPPSTTLSSASGLAGYVPHLPEVSLGESFEVAKQRLYELLLQAVQRRLEDGAVGACLLSGGLDSSIIACALHHLGADMPLITVGVEGAPDLDNARIVAEHLGFEHEVLLFDADQIRQSVPQAVWMLESFDEDCVSGAISNLFASAHARRHTNCILSGEGGDELFGGYHLLKDLPTEAQRLDMMGRLIEVAYNTAVQRLDRAMMGNGINYRTPFIDTDVVAFALQLPVRWKIHDPGNGELIEKYILREAFKGLLPEAIYKRKKLRFSAGTGTDGLMDEVASAEPAAKDFTEQSRQTAEGYQLNSPKELWYYRLFKDRFPAPSFEKLVGRWDPDK